MTRLPDDEWEGLAEEIPAIEEPFIQKYISGRDALVAEEKKRRSGKPAFGLYEIVLT